MRLVRYDGGMFGSRWYAVVGQQETRAHFTRLGAFLAGLRLEPKGGR